MTRPLYTRRTVFTLPLTTEVEAKLTMVWPLTRAEWNRLHELLSAMEPALVEDVDPSEPGSSNAGTV